MKESALVKKSNNLNLETGVPTLPVFVGRQLAKAT